MKCDLLLDLHFNSRAAEKNTLLQVTSLLNTQTVWIFAQQQTKNILYLFFILFNPFNSSNSTYLNIFLYEYILLNLKEKKAKVSDCLFAKNISTIIKVFLYTLKSVIAIHAHVALVL